MGGRGASSGSYRLNINGVITDLIYGDEYHSVMRDGEIKFVVKNYGSTTAPRETMSASEGRIYATVDKNTNRIVAVSFYGSDGVRYKQVDTKNHGKGWHTHDGSDTRTKPRKMSAAEKRLARRVVALWNSRNP